MRKKEKINAYRIEARRKLGVRKPKIPPSKMVISKKGKQLSRSYIKADTRRQAKMLYY